MQPNYTYSAIITNVIDGDTVDATVDLGFSVLTKIRFRLYGIDTPEKTSSIPEIKLLAFTATKWLTDTIDNKSVTIQSVAKDKYGRWLAKIHLGNQLINEQLITLGYAKEYLGDSKTTLWS